MSSVTDEDMGPGYREYIQAIADRAPAINAEKRALIDSHYRASQKQP